MIICLKLINMQLLNVAKFYRRLYGGGQQIITFKFSNFTSLKALFSVDFP